MNNTVFLRTKLAVVAALSMMASVGLSATTDGSDYIAGAPQLKTTFQRPRTYTINVIGDNRGATTEDGDSLAQRDASYNSTIWWRWSMDTEGGYEGTPLGIVVFSTRGSTSESGALDTVLGLYDYNYRQEVAFNDDSDARDGTSEIDLIEVLKGDTFLVGVSGRTDADRGDVKLNIQFKPYVAELRLLPQGGSNTGRSIIRLPEGYRLDDLGFGTDHTETTRGGYKFAGWWTSQDESGLELTGEETMTELDAYMDENGVIYAYAHWVSNGAPELQFDTAYSRTQTITGVFLKNNGGLVGSATVKITKKTAKNIMRASLQVVNYESLKKTSSKNVTLTLAADGTASGNLDIKTKDADGNITEDTLELKLLADGSFSLQGNLFHMEVARIGGAFEARELVFNVPGFAESGYLTDSDGAYWISEAFPVDQKVSVASNGVKLELPASKALKWQKLRPIAAAAGQDRPTRRMSQYRLVDLTSANENKATLKLNYSYKTGMVKGKFTYYQTDTANYGSTVTTTKKPGLNKFSANVKGLVIDEKLWGIATITKPQAAKFLVQMK